MIVSTCDWGAGTWGYELRLDAGGKVCFILGSNQPGVWVYAVTETALELGNRYHLAGQYDGSQIKVVIDGECTATASYNGPVAAPPDVPLGIARRMYDQPFWFYGQIDEVRISNKARY